MADIKNNQRNNGFNREHVRTGDTPLSDVTDQADSAANHNQRNKDVPEKYKYMDEP